MFGPTVGLLLLLPALGAQDQESQQTPRMQFEALLKKFEDAGFAVGAPARAAKTDEDRRKKAIEAVREFDELVPPFLDLAKKYPNDPVAVDVLVFVARQSKRGIDLSSPRLKAMREAMDILVRDHVDNPKIGWLCLIRLSRHPSPLTDRFMRAVFENSSNRQVRGCACAALAKYLGEKARIVNNL